MRVFLIRIHCVLLYRDDVLLVLGRHAPFVSGLLLLRLRGKVRVGGVLHILAVQAVSSLSYRSVHFRAIKGNLLSIDCLLWGPSVSFDKIIFKRSSLLSLF